MPCRASWSWRGARVEGTGVFSATPVGVSLGLPLARCLVGGRGRFDVRSGASRTPDLHKISRAGAGVGRRPQVRRRPALARAVLVSIVVSIPACHAGDRGSIPRRGGDVTFWSLSPSLSSSFTRWVFIPVAHPESVAAWSQGARTSRAARAREAVGPAKEGSGAGLRERRMWQHRAAGRARRRGRRGNRGWIPGRRKGLFFCRDPEDPRVPCACGCWWILGPATWVLSTLGVPSPRRQARGGVRVWDGQALSVLRASQAGRGQGAWGDRRYRAGLGRQGAAPEERRVRDLEAPRARGAMA